MDGWEDVGVPQTSITVAGVDGVISGSLFAVGLSTAWIETRVRCRTVARDQGICADADEGAGGLCRHRDANKQVWGLAMVARRHLD